MKKAAIAGAALAGALVFVPAIGLTVWSAAQNTASAQVPVLGDRTLNADVVPLKELVPWVIKAGSLCDGITPAVLAAQIQQESGWNPSARSPVGALGISQFMPGTWPNWAQDDDGTGQVTPLNPRDAIMAQARYDCALYKAVTGSGHTYNTTDKLGLALAAYNAGLQAVYDAGGIPPFPETQGYVQAIEALIPKYEVAAGAGGAPTAFATAEISAAQHWIGTPYVWGGGSPAGPTGGGFDCSGLVLYAVYQASGGTINLPHSSEIQATMGSEIPRSAMQPGDVIAFQLNGGGDWDHVGIYLGNGQMLEAPHTGDVVKIESLDSPYWQNVPWTVRRFG